MNKSVGYPIQLFYFFPQVEKGETVTIFNVQSQNQNIFLVIETTCPLSTSRARPPSARSLKQQPPVIEEEDEEALAAEEEAAAAAADAHDATAIPDWLRNEFDDAQEHQQHHVPKSRSPQPPQQQQQQQQPQSQGPKVDNLISFQNG